MANILRAKDFPPFGWYYAWVPLDNLANPDKNHPSALKQPKTIKVCWERKSKDVVAKIIPNKGLFGCEFAMIHTFLQFEELIWARLNDKDTDHVKLLYDLMGRCFQQTAKTIWNKAANKVEASACTTDTFLKAHTV